jgi:hypothetical protein
MESFGEFTFKIKAYLHPLSIPLTRRRENSRKIDAEDFWEETLALKIDDSGVKTPKTLVQTLAKESGPANLVFDQVVHTSTEGPETGRRLLIQRSETLGSLS